VVLAEVVVLIPVLLENTRINLSLLRYSVQLHAVAVSCISKLVANGSALKGADLYWNPNRKGKG